MSRYSSGWCGYCNCNSCDCSCGRKTVIQQSKSSCCNTTTGTRFCKEPLVYVTGDFTVPAANVPVEITVSDSSKLYEGQGIQIGTGYFQIREIVDSKTISIAHNGLATVATVITAINPTYGCYTYPIYYVGYVDILTTPSVIGVDEDYEEVDDSVIDAEVYLTFGYIGPNTVKFHLSVSAEIANAPDFLQVELPKDTGSASVQGVFSCIIDNGSGFIPAVAYIQNNLITFGLGGGTALSNGTDRKFEVSGVYEL